MPPNHSTVKDVHAILPAIRSLGKECTIPTNGVAMWHMIAHQFIGGMSRPQKCKSPIGTAHITFRKPVHQILIPLPRRGSM